MNPLHFGSSGRRLFGLYTPARSVAAEERAIVLCHPWGQEYLRAHRSVRQLAVMLAGTGYHALRFDYFGSGDSFGDSTEVDLGGWEKDIESAIDELRDTTGIARVSLAGLRLGGALAARVAARRPEAVDRLVLWDTVISGAEYLDELRESRSPRSGEEPATVRRSVAGGGWEVRGFPLTDDFAREIGNIDLLPLAPDLPRQTFLLASRPQATHALMKAALSEANHPAVMEEILAPPAWLEERNLGAGAIPVNLLHRITSWLG